ncbi:hypothetical protein ABH912_004181 [Pseudomonas sp. BT76 TE3572]|uniref:Uncharacterized protein n=1 Tax=Pseudomonas mandelii PD30 TaxID=1419583 RepID=A0A059KZT9_9PSED|nr:hypothetical protein [Pseudomonas mandelii]KDD67254.1 hypothetical protein V466_20100 [Pseudomonas mandelii PD30]
MKYIFAFLVFSPMASAATVDVCDTSGGAKHFISQWSEDGDQIDTLSRLSGDKFSVQEGKVVYSGDLNGDGIKDFIFTSYGSEGSSKDKTYGFLIQCKGYLKFVGGDYFAKVEVLDKAPETISGFKDVQVYSYQRDGDGNIRYKGKNALTTPHKWSFNPESKKYEGDFE